MKAIVCEMCSSNDLIKKDGVYVCQNCGTKYSLEEAKKLLVEGVVNVEGTVKVDNTSSIENYLQMAENAYDSGNYKEAELYSNKVIEIDSKNYNAWRIKGESAGWQSTLANNRISETANCYINYINNAPEGLNAKLIATTGFKELANATIGLACKHYHDYPSSDTAGTLFDTYTNVLMACAGFKYVPYDDFVNEIGSRIYESVVRTYNQVIKPEYKGDGHPTKYEWDKYVSLSTGVIGLINATIDPKRVEMIPRYKEMITIQNEVVNSYSYRYEVTSGTGYYTKDYYLSPEAKKTRIDKVMEWHQKIKDLDPSYQIPGRPSAKSSGCYIATSVYGSYDCPEVWVLRRFRDYSLSKTVWGRLFIKFYYATSPTLVKWFGDTNWFRQIWRRKLDSMVDSLKNKGYKDEPYEDKNW